MKNEMYMIGYMKGLKFGVGITLLSFTLGFIVQVVLDMI